MSDPVAAREALLVEAIGEAVNLSDSMREQTQVLRQILRDVATARADMGEALTAFETRMNASAQHVKTTAFKHIAAYTQESTRRSIDQQSRAMAEAARVAFGAELGGTMHQLQAMLRALIEARQRRWETWLTHATAAVVASAVTLMLALHFGPR